jgi:hypothetical protein
VTVTFNNGAGLSLLERQAFTEALNYLSRAPGMGEMLSNMGNLNINFVYDGGDSYNPSTNTVSWDPTSAMNVVQANGQVGAQSPALGLFHELCHWYYAHTGNRQFAEESATFIEGQAAFYLGEVIRPSYNTVSAINGFVVVTNPTAHSGGGYWQAVDYTGKPVTGPAYDPNDTKVSIAGGPPGTAGQGSGGGEHNGVGGGGGGVGSGSGSVPVGTGATGGGHWQPVPQHLTAPEPYDTPIVPDEQSVTVIGSAELQYY